MLKGKGKNNFYSAAEIPHPVRVWDGEYPESEEDLKIDSGQASLEFS